MISIKKINNIKVEKLKTKFDDKPYKHYKLFNKPFPLIFINSRRGWGKTSLIYNILWHCALKKKNLWTEIHYFTSTGINDNVFLEMEKKFIKYGFKFFIHENIDFDNEEEKEYNNILEKLYDYSKNLVEDNYEKLKHYKTQWPLFIFVFDDFWKYMKINIMSILCKQSRHTRTMLIYSSQYLHDLPLDCRMNLDYMILFGDVGSEKLEKIYKEIIWKIDLDTFLKIYYDCTSTKYNFLYIDITNNIFRHNFNEEIIINNI